MSIKEAVNKALEKIGHHNGHGVPTTQDPMVPLVHEYNVATQGESYFKARREKAKKELTKSLTDVQNEAIATAVKETKKLGTGKSVSIVETDPYILSVETKKGASFLDTQKLKVELLTKHKMTMTDVDALIERCTGERDPSQSWKVTER